MFSWLWDGGGKVPNASATIPGIIFINAEWAARIVLFPDNEDMHNAFRLTMGHEFTHQENDYFFLEPFTKNEKFVYWVNEKGRRMVNTCKQNRELALLDMRENGEIKGRPTAEQTVREWQEQNPNGTKSDCIRATGLNKKTVYKWWEVRNEEN